MSRAVPGRDYASEGGGPSWLALISRLACAAIVAYFSAVFVNYALGVLAARIAGGLPLAPVWAYQIGDTLYYLMVLAVVAASSVPYFQRDLDPMLRAVSVLTGLFVLGFVALSHGGPVDPNLPFDLFMKHVVTPFQQRFGAG